MFIDDLNTWLAEPGYVRSVWFGYDVLYKFTCEITEAVTNGVLAQQSPLLFYSDTFIRKQGYGESVEEAFNHAKRGLVDCKSVR
jgi:hypothetical protein